MYLGIHSHACLEVKTDSKSLICDPWLVGSAYWRSWWNYPPVKQDCLELIDPDFIYITHLHWDHFHGPTLRKLGLDKTIIIPQTPEQGLVRDLKNIGCKNIIEIPHGKTLKLDDNLLITSYQFYPFISDSALIIEADDTIIFNCNDAKLMGLPLKQILKANPKIDFVLRSHSSANSRVCYEIIDNANNHIDDVSKYSQEFADFCIAVGAKYAIPFASNHCYLHDDTFKYNHLTNYAPKVKKYFTEQQITSPECVVMSPGDGWDSKSGFQFQDFDWYSDLEKHLLEYQQQKRTTLDKDRVREAKVKVNQKLVRKYAQNLFENLPWFIRILFKNRPFTFIAYNSTQKVAFKIDIYNRKLNFIYSWNDSDNPIQIILPARLLNDCIAQKNWTSLGISKRLTIRTYKQYVKYVNIFFFVNPGVDTEFFPIKNWFTPRFIVAYMRRWRELLLYIQVFIDLILKKGFVYSRYLPRLGKN